MPRSNVGVGQSEGRTPGKHDLMNKLIGREVAVLQHDPRRMFDTGSWTDLTAGDGAATFGREWIKSCSPGILAHHGRYPKLAKPLTIHLYEKARATHATLLENLARELKTLDYERLAEDHWRFRRTNLFVHHADAATAGVDHVTRRTAVMLVNDPNNVDRWACPAPLLADLQARSSYVLMLSTMGCNPGGLKQSRWEKRRKWYEHVEAQSAARAPWHGLYLCAIERDDAQWAYLITAPACWDGKVEEDARSAFGRYGLSLEGVWRDRDPDEFTRIEDVLFKTIAQRAEEGS